ncbi:uncharacterized protein LOC121876802 isoform X2 [Homarus americanus]|nr:uncharacterized protein LOC121876802 isoform X2 [Homarus americanus]
MLLQQLKERLQSRGDSEGNDLVGVLEAVICGQGSLGGLGAGNPPPSAYKSSAHYPPVFPSESNIYSSHPSFQQRRKQENIDTRVSLNVPHEYHQNSNYHPRKVRTDPHTEQTGEEYLPQNLQDQHQMNNGFPQQTSDHPTTHRQYPYQSTVQDLQDKPIEDEATHHHTVYRDSQHHVPQETSNHNKLIQKITRQSEVMAEQERIITELRKLSSQLIAQQEKITLKNLQQDKEADAVNCDLNTNTQPPVVDMDSGVGGESHDTTGSDKIVVSGEGERGDNNSSNNKQAQQRNVNKMSQTEQNYRSELLRLQTENVALLREVRSHRELVVNLEIQLSKAYNLLDLEQQSHSKLLVSKLSSSAPNLDIVGNQARTTHDGKSSHLRAPSNPSESEADSAYEEKTGSHLTSKINSPHSDMQKGKDSATSLSEISSEKHKEDEQDQDPQGQSSNIVPTDTALLHAVYNNKDKTVLNAVMNSSTIPTSQFILQQRVPETQETPDDEVKSSVSDRPPRYNVKASDQANYHGISARKEDKTAGAQKPYFAKTIGIEANNLYMEPTAPLEECVFSSFSTVNDNNPQDSMITQETSFLKGIKAPRQNRNTISLEGKLETLEGINSSFVGLHQPLESTRLQEGSHKLPNISEDESSVFAPMKAHKSYNSTSFESVDKLD